MGSSVPIGPAPQKQMPPHPPATLPVPVEQHRVSEHGGGSSVEAQRLFHVQGVRGDQDQDPEQDRDQDRPGGRGTRRHLSAGCVTDD